MSRRADAAPTASAVVERSRSQCPLVSVIVPVYNGQEYLRESLESILEQTYANIEVIVMDDCSSDRSPEIARALGDRIQYFRQRSTRGIYGNANDGIARAEGDLIAVFHADDVYLHTIVERQVEFMQNHPEVGAVFASDIFVDADGRELGRLTLPPELRGETPLDYAVVLNALLKYKNRFLRCPTAMVRASVYRELGGYRDAEFKNTSDIDMWLRIARRHPIGILEEHLLLYRRGHGSSSERYHRVRTEQERFFTIVDRELGDGGRAVARTDALTAYEAHRAQDRLIRAANLYILGDKNEARAALSSLRGRTLRASSQLDRTRLTTLLALMRLVVRLPWSAAFARLLHRRWYGTGELPPRRLVVSHELEESG